MKRVVNIHCEKCPFTFIVHFLSSQLIAWRESLWLVEKYFLYFHVMIYNVSLIYCAFYSGKLKMFWLNRKYFSTGHTVSLQAKSCDERKCFLWLWRTLSLLFHFHCENVLSLLLWKMYFHFHYENVISLIENVLSLLLWEMYVLSLSLWEMYFHFHFHNEKRAFREQRKDYCDKFESLVTDVLMPLSFFLSTFDFVCWFFEGQFFYTSFITPSSELSWALAPRFNPLVPRVQRIKIRLLALTDFYWLKL